MFISRSIESTLAKIFIQFLIISTFSLINFHAKDKNLSINLYNFYFSLNCTRLKNQIHLQRDIYLIYKVIDPLLKYFSRSSLIIDERKRNPEGFRRESKQTFNPQTWVPTSRGTRTIRLSNANIICTRPLYRHRGRGAARSISYRGWIPNPLPPSFPSSCWNRVSKRIN